MIYGERDVIGVSLESKVSVRQVEHWEKASQAKGECQQRPGG